MHAHSRSADRHRLEHTGYTSFPFGENLNPLISDHTTSSIKVSDKLSKTLEHDDL